MLWDFSERVTSKFNSHDQNKEQPLAFVTFGKLEKNGLSHARMAETRRKQIAISILNT